MYSSYFYGTANIVGNVEPVFIMHYSADAVRKVFPTKSQCDSFPVKQGTKQAAIKNRP